MIDAAVIDSYSILEHGVVEDANHYDLPRQRLTRKLRPEEVAEIRELAVTIPAYRIWRMMFAGVCSYHTVRRAAKREQYKEQP